ncbi:ABC transporter permease [Pararobbsia silviterrae]|uniref:Iron export ABC transporter permease subunit FetB n=1 Tax=Pararobbsia silviterrae TaxID=1792498 RepID=A0A494XW35_9BURK|nr:iron export ABC transporter permease subunit FetB [Pararobbsia silviterrae]RKP54823.1 iron export ABC transporter permease subunit FetB [Pararobbsia silviterrae]
MTPSRYVDLSYADVAIAAALIVFDGALSVWLKLGLVRTLAVASVRTVVQLLAIGFVLSWVFGHPQWPIAVAVMITMTVIAGWSASGRGARTYRGLRIDALAAIGLSGWAVATIGLVVVIGVRPWYTPQYAIPILGMILGNSLSAVSLGLERMTEELTARRAQVETLLALGATRREAALASARIAVRAGMMPTLNQMTVVGLVSLPGMMTGQVLAGQHPEQAVRYQIVIMFLLAAASAGATVLAVVFASARLFTSDHRFVASRLVERSRAASLRADRR